LWALLVWFPLSRIGAHYSIEYNEGFNASAENGAFVEPACGAADHHRPSDKNIFLDIIILSEYQ
jgi:hypothetical protein